MEQNRRRHKHTRAYNSTNRLAQAERTRATVLDVAERMFLQYGYGATTLASIAEATHVSVETIYKAFGGKPGLVRAIRDRALAGEGPIHAERRSDAIRMRESNPRTIIRSWGSFVAELAPRGSPILLLVRDAAVSDPEMAALRAEMDADRLKRMSVNARHLHRRGYLRPGVSLKEATDVLWTYSSAEFYELLVIRRGWSKERYGRFVADAMSAALLPPESK
jgi:AcrR family transcriptional regulator